MDKQIRLFEFCDWFVSSFFLIWNYLNSKSLNYLSSVLCQLLLHIIMLYIIGYWIVIWFLWRKLSFKFGYYLPDCIINETCWKYLIKKVVVIIVNLKVFNWHFWMFNIYLGPKRLTTKKVFMGNSKAMPGEVYLRYAKSRVDVIKTIFCKYCEMAVITENFLRAK